MGSLVIRPSFFMNVCVLEVLVGGFSNSTRRDASPVSSLYRKLLALTSSYFTFTESI